MAKLAQRSTFMPGKEGGCISPGSYLGYPSFEHFMESWTPYVKKRARKYGFSSYSELDDIAQDIFMDFWEKNYDKIFNPSRSSWSTFFTSFIHYRLLNRITRKFRNPLNRYIPIEDSVRDGEKSSGVLNLECFVSSDSCTDRIEYNDFIERIRKEIEFTHPNRRGFVPSYFLCKKCDSKVINPQVDKVCHKCSHKKWRPVLPVEGDEKIERSHLMVFDLLVMKEYTRKQVAQKLKLSEASISILVRDVSELPIMVDFWDQYHGISGVSGI